uniref:Uncharacterized protein n=1 Tax=Trichogramma kaykai TaxID=54128 RepID=A0ABD2X7K6_9HYME
MYESILSRLALEHHVADAESVACLSSAERAVVLLRPQLTSFRAVTALMEAEYCDTMQFAVSRSVASGSWDGVSVRSRTFIPETACGSQISSL